MRYSRKVRKETDLLTEFIALTEKAVIEQTTAEQTLPRDQLVTLLDVSVASLVLMCCYFIG